MFLKNSAFALGRELRVDLWENFRVFVWLSTIDKHRVRGVDSAKGPYNNLPGGVAQGHILIPVISSEFGVNGSGVEQNDGNGSSTSKSGLRNMQWKRRTSKKSRTCATFPNHVSVLSRMCVWRVPSNAEHWQDSEKCAGDEVFCLRTANGVEMRLWSLGSGEFLSLWQTIYQRHSFEWISRGFDVSFPCIDDDKKAVGHRCLAWQNLAGLDAMGQTVVAAWFQDEPHNNLYMLRSKSSDWAWAIAVLPFIFTVSVLSISGANSYGWRVHCVPPRFIRIHEPLWIGVDTEVSMHKRPWSSETKTSRPRPTWVVAMMFLLILEPSI